MGDEFAPARSAMNAVGRAGRVCAALFCVLAACSKEGSNRSAATTAQLDNPASSSDGARIYATNCSGCHQLDGRGLPGAFPPLAGSPAVTGDPRRAIAAVKYGLRTKAAGSGLGSVMPAWEGLLSDGDIAAVVTYIRFAWHNDASPVSPRQVEEVGLYKKLTKSAWSPPRPKR